MWISSAFDEPIIEPIESDDYANAATSTGILEQLFTPFRTLSTLVLSKQIFPIEIGLKIIKKRARKSSGIQERIIFGENAVPGQFPFVGLAISFLFYPNATDFDPNDSIDCTCSLITSEFILYKASCIDTDQLQKNYRGSQYFFGSVDRLDFPINASGLGYAVHPLFNFAGCYMNDIAIQKLDTKITDFSPVKLPSRLSSYLDYQGRTMVAVGFGFNENDDSLQYLQYTSLQVSSNIECAIRLALNLRAAPNLICAQSSDASGVCYNDDGGPLIFQDKLFGIIDSFRIVNTRFANEVTCFDGFTGFLRVDAYLDWIASVTGQSIDWF